MTIQTEGFGFSSTYSDYVTYGRMTTGRGSPTITTGGGPAGQNNLAAVLGAGTGIAVSFAPKTLILGARINPNGKLCEIGFADPSAVSARNVTLNINSGNAGIISVLRGDYNGAVLGTTADNAIEANGWGYLEAQVTIDATAGAVQLWYNGTSILNLSGVNTQGFAGSESVGFAMFGQTAGGSDLSYIPLTCDVYMADTTSGRQGDCRVLTVAPSANAAVQFTPAGLASNFQNAAKIPPVPATDYNSSGTIGAADLFTTGGVASQYSDIRCVAVKSLFYKSDAGSRSMANIIKSGATQVAGATLALSTSAETQADYWTADPATGAKWTQAAVDALEIGYEVVS